jgi:hypothetical protein
MKMLMLSFLAFSAVQCRLSGHDQADGNLRQSLVEISPFLMKIAVKKSFDIRPAACPG